MDTKNGPNSIIRCFFPRRAKNAAAEGQNPPQELEEGPHSGSYLLVSLIFFLHDGKLNMRLFLLLSEAQSSGFVPVCKVAKMSANLHKGDQNKEGDRNQEGDQNEEGD